MSSHGEHNLRRYVAARSAGDLRAAREHWNELVSENFDRVRGWVRIESHGRLSAEEQEEALQDALVRLLHNMFGTFRGTSMGEWVNATKKLVHWACIDVQERAATHRRRTSPLYAPGADGEDTEQLHPDVADDIKKRHEAELERHTALVDDRALLRALLPQLSDKRRAVVEADLAGVPGDEMPGLLGMTRDAVYQNRRRAYADLAKLRREQSP